MNKKSFTGKNLEPSKISLIQSKANLTIKNNFNPSLTFRRIWTDYLSYGKKWAWMSFFFSLFGACLQATALYYIGIIYDQFFMSNDQAIVNCFGTFILLLVTSVAIFGLNNLFVYLNSIMMIKLSEQYLCYKLRGDLFSKIQKLPVKYFDLNASGEIMTRASMDVDNISSAVAFGFVQMMYYFFTFIAVTIIMIMINFALGLITIAIYPIFTYCSFKFMMMIAPYFEKQQKEVGKLNAFVEERISGIKIVSLFRKEKLNQEEFAVINEHLTKNSITANAFSNILTPFNVFFNNLSFIILTAVGIYLVIIGAIKTDWGIKAYQSKSALLIVFTIFSRNLTNPLNQMISGIPQLMLATASAQRIFNVLDAPEEKDEPNAVNIKNVKGVVEAKHLYFGYDTNKMILKDINFIAKPNEIIALVGPTGAGKTTIASLITKFYNITRGDLLIDGKSIRKITSSSLRKNITIVLQDTFLFNRSIRDNIRFGRLDATDEEVENAAKLAEADKFIKYMPNGYETIIGANGVTLSQGQRQLLAIARAFLADSKIIILDEASSSIDTKTELDVQKSLKTLMKNRTTFMIAHRLSTIRDANNILVINDGMIIEQGTHEELIQKNGFYANLYNSQFKKGVQI